MDRLAGILQAIGYHAVQVQPLLPMNLHLIVSALFPIYVGAHASLSRPSAAAKPPKRKKIIESDDDEEDDDTEQKMEGMSPIDAIMLPLLAGCTLAGLYFIIKWLEDPATLNKILNWYFSVFGILALAKLITDVMGTITSVVFPSMYTSEGKIWRVDGKIKQARSSSADPIIRDSPLPGRLSTVPLPKAAKTLLWTLRDIPSKRLQFRFYIYGVARGKFKVGPQGLLAFALALTGQIYFNLVDKPWWLTNALGFSLAYNALQLLSPTTAWTGTLILGALFFYDIYFVFYTPLMVTVATKLDIPAKLLFPRPSGPTDDPAKQALSMLGLGDIVLPGMMIGFALRFDLYLFYLRKQIRRDVKDTANDEKATDKSATKPAETFVMEKDKWYPATSGWGERLWTSRRALVTSNRYHGIIFPKAYFHATIIGYVAGMLVTLGIMQIFHHAQPALLYLVPGVLGAFWGTALANGDLKTLWAYSEADEEEEGKEEGKDGEGSATEGAWSWMAWKNMLLGTETKKKVEEAAKREEKGDQSGGKSDGNGDKVPSSGNVNDKDFPRRDRKRELVYFSIYLPDTAAEAPKGASDQDTLNSQPSESAAEKKRNGESKEVDAGSS